MDISAKLRQLATNLLWCWRPHTVAIFRDIDVELWREVNHNPSAFLDRISPEKLKERAVDLALDSRLNYAFHRLQDYLDDDCSWGKIHCGPLSARPVAFFSAEFGLHESIPVYSGGLGVLAGDHMKAASDLGVPTVGIGLFYAQGYFSQHLDKEGWQHESYFDTRIEHLPFEKVKDKNGKLLLIHVETKTAKIWLRVWRTQVGRNWLYLLDSDVKENIESDRQLTGRLYGGDHNVRIRQELIMGVGGARALTAAGIKPGIMHLNEGHSAFALLEMARQEMEVDGIDFFDAIRRVAGRTVFVTHTPVDAGHDRFGAELIEEVLGPMQAALGLTHEEMMGLGRKDPRDQSELFCMTVLGLKYARRANAVSSLNGEVTRRMWRDLWPERGEFDIPIGHVTNGVHAFSWMAAPMRQLFDSCLQPDWFAHMVKPSTWAPARNLRSSEMWEAHQVLKAQLVSYIQRQVARQEAARGGENSEEVMQHVRKLSADILTIGFARRFATYKRGDMIFSDLERLERLILNEKCPIQIVFAGKAHPRDEPGKELIQRIFKMAQNPKFGGRIVFIENYDINVGRHLVQGVDVWLNTPLRPREASGTSGMKAVFNGVLNLSVLDGWWAEAYDGQNGFAIGSGQEHADVEVQNRRDAVALYDVLEKEVIPLYYNRDDDGVPRGWVNRMKNAIISLAWRFNASRMVMDYVKNAYLPLANCGPIRFED